MATNVMRITLKAYDHNQIDHAAGKIIETVKKTGAKVSGPVPLPTKKEVVTILRAVHKYIDKNGNAIWCCSSIKNERKIKTSKSLGFI